MEISSSKAFLAFSLALAAWCSSAGASPFSGTLGLASGASGAASFPGAGSGTSTADRFTVPGGAFMGSATLPWTAGPPFTAIVISVAGNGRGSFEGIYGTMPVFGIAAIKANVGLGPFTIAQVPLFTTHHAGSHIAPAGVGVGATIDATILNTPMAGDYLRLYGDRWAEGVRTVTGLTYTLHLHYSTGPQASQTGTALYWNATAMYTGSDVRTPGGAGQVTLVSPIKVATNLTGTRLVQVALGTLTLNFVPEPGTLLLLGSGVAILAFLGRRRIGRD